jgi:hypothetical protein
VSQNANPYVFFRQWLGLAYIDDDAGDKATQVESVIEPVRKGIKVGEWVYLRNFSALKAPDNMVFRLPSTVLLELDLVAGHRSTPC